MWLLLPGLFLNVPVLAWAGVGMLGLIVIKRTLGSVFVRHVRFDVCVAERRDVQRVSTLGPRRRGLGVAAPAMLERGTAICARWWGL